VSGSLLLPSFRHGFRRQDARILAAAGEQQCSNIAKSIITEVRQLTASL
jgi:hypothetical protein